MRRQREKSLRVGLLVSASILVFVFIIYFIGSKDNLFKQQTKITTTFRDIRGLVVGNNVRFSGITVGKVSNITITDENIVTLQLSITSEYARFIPKNSVAEISQDGLVGNKLISISSGDSSAGYIENGSHIRGREGVDVENMLFETQNLLVQTRDALVHLKAISEKINTGDGDLAKLLNDDQVSREINQLSGEVSKTLNHLNRIAQKVDSGDGDIANLLNNNELGEKAMDVLENLNEMSSKTQTVISELEKTTQQINSGEGPLGMLLHSKETAENIDSTILKLQNSLDEFDKTAITIRESRLLKMFSGRKKERKKAND